jgi:hypothetical protein
MLSSYQNIQRDDQRMSALGYSARRPASVIRTRAISIDLPPATMRSEDAAASPSRIISTIILGVKLCASMIASVQPSRLAAAVSSARTRLSFGWRRAAGGAAAGGVIALATTIRIYLLTT